MTIVAQSVYFRPFPILYFTFLFASMHTLYQGGAGARVVATARQRRECFLGGPLGAFSPSEARTMGAGIRRRF